MTFTEILVSQGGSQGARQCGSSSARSFDLARPGVAPPMLSIVKPDGSEHSMPEMEPGLRVTAHRVTGSAILAGSGRVTGQCVRPGV